MNILPLDPGSPFGVAVARVMAFGPTSALTNTLRRYGFRLNSNRELEHIVTGDIASPSLDEPHLFEWISDPQILSTGIWPDANGIKTEYTNGVPQGPPRFTWTPGGTTPTSNPSPGAASGSGNTSGGSAPLITTLNSIGIYDSRVSNSSLLNRLPRMEIPEAYKDFDTVTIQVNSDFGIPIYTYVNPYMTPSSILAIRQSEVGRKFFGYGWYYATLEDYRSEPTAWRLY
jgi:hypothetical protein